MYKLMEGGVFRIDDGASIPSDPRNVDWQEYLAWLRAGNRPHPADSPPAAEPTLSRETAALLSVIAEVTGRTEQEVADAFETKRAAPRQPISRVEAR